MRHIGKVIFIILLVGVTWVFITLLNTQIDRTKDITEDIKDTQSIVNDATASTIIKQVENAYSAAYMSNLSYPTLEDVKSKFGCRGVTWSDTYVIEAQNFNCNVEVINNNLKVTCLDYETKSDLILSN